MSRSWILLFGVVSTSCGCDPHVGRQKDKVEAAHESSSEAPMIEGSCLRAISAYVEQTRGWTRASYVVRPESSISTEKGFAVEHIDDVGAILPKQNLKSFHIDLNRSCDTVLRELGYQ